MMQFQTARISLSLAAAACLLLGSVRACAFQGPQQSRPAAQEHEHQPAAGENTPSSPTKVAIPDVVVLDQNNQKVRFYSDLVKGKIVAVNFMFTTCTTICSPMTANLARVQKMLLARGEKNVHFISVSVDPEGDTPEKLKSYAAMFHAQPGWTFVTGTRAQLEPIWRAFGVPMGAKEDHTATVVIGNDARHDWTYGSGLTSADKLVAVIQSVTENKNPKATANGS
jgi:cytochrome oxidase Cu insertion factor (SCO1/SenC/PrrC family)